MANTQVRVELIYHARGHYLAVAGYRYIVKTRKQGRDAELRFPKNHSHPPNFDLCKK